VDCSGSTEYTEWAQNTQKAQNRFFVLFFTTELRFLRRLTNQ
jgi:hypothetical protein